MKKCYGILLLACLSLPVLGTYTWLHYQKLCVKLELQKILEAGISENHLLRLAFTPGQVDTLLHWEHEKEFEFQEQMYDVIKQEHKVDSIVFWCWWDQKETLLNLQLEDLVQKAFAQHPTRKHAEEQLSLFFKTLYCDFPEPLSHIPVVLQMADQKHGFATVSFYGLNQGEPPTPPPQ